MSHTENTCTKCNNSYIPTRKNQKFCSPECYSDNRRTWDKVEKTCPICNKNFVPYVESQLTCSKECGSIKSASSRSGVKKYEYTCDHCGSKFLNRKKDKKFCSKQCYHDSKNNEVTFNCQECGKAKTVAYRFREQIYCDQTCMGKSLSLSSVLAVSPLFQAGCS